MCGGCNFFFVNGRIVGFDYRNYVVDYNLIVYYMNFDVDYSSIVGYTNFVDYSLIGYTKAFFYFG